MSTIEKIPVIGAVVKTYNELEKAINETIALLQNGGGEKLRKIYKEKKHASK